MRRENLELRATRAALGHITAGAGPSASTTSFISWRNQGAHCA